MPVVRCPTHNVPYNDENPRGCPACWQERFGADPANVMRELARASKAIPRVEILPPPTEEEVPPQRLSGVWPPPVTPPPRVPMPEPTRLERLGRWLRAHAGVVALVLVGSVAATLVWLITRPTFEEALQPPALSGEPLPLPVAPNSPLVAVFAVLGPRTPQAHPADRRLARYDFGGGALVDVYNGSVYALTLTSPGRSWEGHRVGTPETPARGRLALLGAVQVQEPPAAAPFPLGGYLAFRSPADLPHRYLTAEVRPPNGCFDVRLDIAPQIIGRAARGDETFVAVGRRGGAVTWVVHEVLVRSRAVAGPGGQPPACE